MVVLAVWEQPRIELVPLKCYEFIMWFGSVICSYQQGPQSFLVCLIQRYSDEVLRVWERYRKHYRKMKFSGERPSVRKVYRYLMLGGR